MFVTHDGGATWSPSFVSRQYGELSLFDLAVTDRSFVASSVWRNTSISTDGGSSWVPTLDHAVRLACTDSIIFASGSHLHESYDGGMTWGLATSPPKGINSVASFRGEVFVASYGYGGSYGGGAYLLSADQTEWIPITRGLTTTYLTSIVNRGIDLFVSSRDAGVFRSIANGSAWRNNGAAWEAINAGLPEPNILKIVVSGTRIFCATKSHGIYLLTNDESRWVPINDGLGTFSLRALVATDSNLYATGNFERDNSSLWRLSTTRLQTSCCISKVGDINADGIADVSDLSLLVSYMTGGSASLTCSEEADLNHSGTVDASDLSAMVNYSTGGGFVLPNCP